MRSGRGVGAFVDASADGHWSFVTGTIEIDVNG